jgi:hypothetical protein
MQIIPLQGTGYRLQATQIQKEGNRASTHVFFICAFSAYRFLANLLPLAPSNFTHDNMKK